MHSLEAQAHEDTAPTSSSVGEWKAVSMELTTRPVTQPAAKGFTFDEQLRTYQNGGKDGAKPSPTFFNFDAFSPSSFLRPPVWTGAGHADDGLLGCQAPAADGLDETFTVFPPQALVQPVESPKAPEEKAVAPLPSLPAEIHLQIIADIVRESEFDSCSFCHLFQLSNLSKVSRLYHQIAEPFLYDALHLNFNSSLSKSLNNRRDTRTICDDHLRLASKHQQLELRIPLLLRTLSSRPDLAIHVRKIVLPAGGTKTYLACSLEKTLIPNLIRCCPNIQEIEGVDNLLSRQFFSGEHYCLDGTDPQQHGILAKTIHETKSLRKWTWRGGNASGRDFNSRLWDYNPAMRGIGFVATHRNWEQLETFEIRDVWNLDFDMMATLIPMLPCLRTVSLVGIRKKRVGRGDAALILKTLEILPASVKSLELGNTADPGFLEAVGEWVRVRHTIKEFSMLESLRISEVKFTPANLKSFFTAISIKKVSGYRNIYLPLLDFYPQYRSVIQHLGFDNTGFEEAFDDLGHQDQNTNVGCMELRGLEGLDWRIRSTDVGNASRYLETRLRCGWFADLKGVEVIEQHDENIVCVAKERGIYVI